MTSRSPVYKAKGAGVAGNPVPRRVPHSLPRPAPLNPTPIQAAAKRAAAARQARLDAVEAAKAASAPSKPLTYDKPINSIKRRNAMTTTPTKTTARKATPRKRATAPAKAHPLAYLIPDPAFAEDYVSRKVDGVEDKTIVRIAQREKQNLLIEGPTGPGKTSLVYAVAAEDRRPLGCVSCNGAVDPRELFGGWVPDPSGNGKLIWQDGLVPALMRHGGILYLDEINFLPPRIAAVLHSVTDRRRSITLMDHGNEFIQAHPDFQVIATYNDGYEDTRPLNEAFKNRWCFKLSWGYDPEVEKELVNSPTLLKLAEQLRQRHEAGDIRTPVSTNLLQELELLSMDDDLGPQWAIKNFINAFHKDEREAVSKAVEAVWDRLGDELAGYDFIEVEVDVDEDEVDIDEDNIEDPDA